MKKALTLLLALVMCLSLAGCKSKEVKHTESLIEAIGEVTLESESVIVAAEEAYNALSDEDKAEVENYEVLVSARATFESFFETVEITMDNWQEYFEIGYKESWEKNAFGEMDYLRCDNCLYIRDAYAGRIDPKDVDIQVAYSTPPIWRYCQIDWENRVFTVGEPSGNTSETGSPDSVWPTYTSATSEMKTQDLQEGRVASLGFCTIIMASDMGEDVYLEEAIISRIQGTIKIQIN